MRGSLLNELCLVVLILTTFCTTQSTLQLENLRRDEIALLLYDSRPLENYWLAAASWNKHYCDLHGHIFIYYSGKECEYDTFTRLASPWCKVKAMRQVTQILLMQQSEVGILS